MPLLTVFAALFGYLLVTIHDTEFYGDDNQPSQVAAATVSQSVVPTAAVSEEAKVRRAHFENRNSNSAGPSTLSHQISTNISPYVWMPFTLKELVPMSLSLRDVTIGLVELAFPESRPVVKEEYKQAVK